MYVFGRFCYFFSPICSDDFGVCAVVFLHAPYVTLFMRFSFVPHFVVSLLFCVCALSLSIDKKNRIAVIDMKQCNFSFVFTKPTRDLFSLSNCLVMHNHPIHIIQMRILFIKVEFIHFRLMLSHILSICNKFNGTGMERHNHSTS